MSNDNTSPSDVAIYPIVRAIRFAFAALVVGLSLVSLRSAIMIKDFGSIFADMLPGTPLPALTRLLLEHRTMLVAISCGIPLGALFTLLDRKPSRSFYQLGCLILTALSLNAVIYLGLLAPFTGIITRMAEPAQ